MEEWRFCDGNHEYAAEYSRLFGREVCWLCDPESSANRHRPAAVEAVSKALEQFPVRFLDREHMIVPYTKLESFDLKYKDRLICPECRGFIRFYEVNGSTRWACDCQD